MPAFVSSTPFLLVQPGKAGVCSRDGRRQGRLSTHVPHQNKAESDHQTRSLRAQAGGEPLPERIDQPSDAAIEQIASEIVSRSASPEPGLSMDAYRVLRENGTEWPFTSELLAEKRHGTFSCASCGTELFSSTTKYDSRTGWPSFFDAIPGSVKLQASLMDRLFGQREVRCGTCGGHLGHVFRDGPQPTGDRFCINGVVLEFNPESGPVIDVLVDE